MSPDGPSGLAALATVALVAVRLYGVLFVQPHWRRVIGPWWWAVAATFALVLAPVLSSGVAPLGLDAPWAWIGLGLLELLLGLVLGLALALPVHGLIGALDMSGRGLGLHAAGGRTLTGLGLALVVGGGLALGLHRPLLVGLTSLLDAWPVGRPGEWASAAAGAGPVIEAAHGMLLLALALATPVLLSLAVADLGLRLIGRGPAPADTLTEAVRPWLRTAAALVALGASWSVYPEAWMRGLG